MRTIVGDPGKCMGTWVVEELFNYGESYWGSPDGYNLEGGNDSNAI